MKRVLFGILVLVLLVSIGLASCTTPAPSPSATPTPTAKPSPSPTASPTASPKPSVPTGELPKDFVGIASGEDISYSQTAFLTKMVEKYTTMKGSMQKSPGASEDLDAVNTGKAMITVISTPIPAMMRDQGSHLRALASASTVPASSTIIGYHTLPRDDIKKWADLKGKTVYHKPTMLFARSLSAALLKANGMAPTDIQYLDFIKTPDAFNDVKQKRVDAIVFVASGLTAEMAQTTGVYIIPYTPAEQKAIEDLNFGFMASTWPAGLWGNKVATPTVLATQAIFSSVNTSDLVAYTFTKMLFEHIADFNASEKAAEGFTLKDATTQWAIPYHAGAIAYFKEKGVWGPEQDAKQAKLLALEKAQK